MTLTYPEHSIIRLTFSVNHPDLIGVGMLREEYGKQVDKEA